MKRASSNGKFSTQNSFIILIWNVLKEPLLSFSMLNTYDWMRAEHYYCCNASHAHTLVHGVRVIIRLLCFPLLRLRISIGSVWPKKNTNHSLECSAPYAPMLKYQTSTFFCWRLVVTSIFLYVLCKHVNDLWEKKNPLHSF